MFDFPTANILSYWSGISLYFPLNGAQAGEEEILNLRGIDRHSSALPLCRGQIAGAEDRAGSACLNNVSGLISGIPTRFRAPRSAAAG